MIEQSDQPDLVGVHPHTQTHHAELAELKSLFQFLNYDEFKEITEQPAFVSSRHNADDRHVPES